ncbi:hypothetical protein [Variovorax sp. OV329]|uniref:hypothetical protein n=1 Tax=Variovorax sp. OV329 TaxID=1882825 RepID=UPI000B86D224|nr:hypothetical protein [Variovorax sp. OV329]
MFFFVGFLPRVDHAAQPLAFDFEGSDPGAGVPSFVEGVFMQGGEPPTAFEPGGELDQARGVAAGLLAW